MLFGKGRKQKLESLHRAVTAKARRRKATLCSAIPEFMTVEPRRLFSTISVTQFGALPNTGVDAKSEVQAALNSAQSGDTVSFPAGYFIVGGKLSVPTGVTITGAG
jgi:polygalacturonase